MLIRLPLLVRQYAAFVRFGVRPDLLLAFVGLFFCREVPAWTRTLRKYGATRCGTLFVIRAIDTAHILNSPQAATPRPAANQTPAMVPSPVALSPLLLGGSARRIGS
jgi:hypothetical protein